MATRRDNPYARFNFLVSWDGLDEETVEAGFSEVSGLGMEIQVVEYRAGNDKENHVRKIAGLHRVPDVTLKRGLIGSLDLWEWVVEVRNGSQDARRDVTIRLLSEDRQTVAQAWRLRNAMPLRYAGPELDARASDEVAIEELTLCCEGIDLE